MHTTHIAVDTSKTVFTLHASDAIGHCTGRFDLKRAKFLAYFEKQPSLTSRWRHAAAHIIGDAS